MGQLTNKRTSKIQASYKLEGTVLENVESIKYLGVTITKDSKWNTHISNVCTKANRTLVFRRNLFSRPHDFETLHEAPVIELYKLYLNHNLGMILPYFDNVILGHLYI